MIQHTIGPCSDREKAAQSIERFIEMVRSTLTVALANNRQAITLEVDQKTKDLYDAEGGYGAAPVDAYFTGEVRLTVQIEADPLAPELARVMLERKAGA